MKFNTGERVRFIDDPEVVGRVLKNYTSADGDNAYLIEYDDERGTEIVDEGNLEKFDNVTYDIKLEYLENLVVARLYEKHEDGWRDEIAKGHGHIFHDGALGIAQAASYALKKLYQKLEENNN